MLVSCQGENISGETIAAPSIRYSFVVANALIDLCTFSCLADGMTSSWVQMPSKIDVQMSEE